MTPPTAVNIERYMREREACHLYVLDDGPPAR